VKAKFRRLPRTMAEDPRKAIGVVAAGAGTVLAIAALRRRGRRSVPAGNLPPEVEAALAGLGKDGKKVREALDRSFSQYIVSHGLAEPSSGRSLPPGVKPLILPIATVAIREIFKRTGSRRARSSSLKGRPGETPAETSSGE
jgi:hypothetical protein